MLNNPPVTPCRRSPREFNNFLLSLVIWNLVLLTCGLYCLYAQENKVEPIIVNGDTVEYSADVKEVTATGNVEVNYKGSKLTCRKITVNTQTKEGIAEGSARLDDRKGVINGEKIIYNFQTKTGTIVDSQFRVNPYFGRAAKVEKVSDAEFIARHGYVTTCSLDRPHYRIKSKQINLFPQDKIQTKENSFYLGNIPLLYLPRYNHSLTGPLMHVQVMPGSRKDWGPYLLSAWRYNLTTGMDGRVYLDYRSKLGPAGGFGLNYATQDFGKGDYKFYYSLEKPDNLPAGAPTEYDRYFMRLRHKWNIGERTNLIAEFYKITDERRKYDASRNILKDYFFREYEKDSAPLSYALLHHAFNYSSIDILMQKRTNHWYDQLDKLPEVKYTMPALQLGYTPLYFENNSVFTSFNKKGSTAPTQTPPSQDDLTVRRLDTINKLSMPMKVAFFKFTPFVQNREIVYDKGADGQALPVNTVFYAGADLSTKFYKISHLKTNFLGLGLDGLRHIITPTVGYSYNHKPTIYYTHLKQIDSLDMLTSSNAVTLELSNKLQTKRKDKDGRETSVDFVDFNVSTSYTFAPHIVYGMVLVDNPTSDPNAPKVYQAGTSNKLGASFSDILFKYKLLPYSWLRIEGDATYKHSGVAGDPNFDNYNHFSNVNYDVNFDLAPERSFGFGQRYARKSGNQLTASFNWRLNPKWKLSVYERYNLKKYADTSTYTVNEFGKGSLEQEYTLSRDLHCWAMDLTFNTSRVNGSGIFIIFRLKAFPEMEVNLHQNYARPKSGAQ